LEVILLSFGGLLGLTECLSFSHLVLSFLRIKVSHFAHQVKFTKNNNNSSGIKTCFWGGFGLFIEVLAA